MNKASLKELLARWKERAELIQSRDFSLSATPEQADERRKRARRDYAYFVRTYFPHLATSACGKFQTDAARYLLQNRNTRAVFEWSRGHAKSSHLSLMIPLWLKIQEPQQLRVMVLASKSEELAVRLLSDLQAELEYNEAFVRDFGTQVAEGNWAAGEFKTADGCAFIAVGRGQSPRGLKDRGKRPDYIVIDDIDDDEIVQNPKRVKRAVSWCLEALMGTMAVGRGRFVLVGNRIAKNSILAHMAARPGVHHTRVDILDRSGRPSWPENYTSEEIANLRQFIGERSFQKEYMNNPITEGTIFLQKHLRYGRMLDLKHYRTLVCYTDPSFKNSANSDFKATMLVGKTPEGEYHVLRAYADQTSVSAMIRWHYDIHDRIAGRVPVLYYMESNFLQDLLLDEFRKEGAACGMQIPIRGDARKKPDKFARIEALQPLFERGLVVFNEKERDSPGMRVLVEQLLMFERGSRIHDDAPDALEGAIFLLTRRTGSAGAPGYSFGERPSRRF